MMNDLKLGFRLLRYAYGIKMNIVMGIIFVIYGLFMQWISISDEQRFPMGGYFFLCAAMLFMQLIMSVNFASFVASSSQKKRLETRVSITVNTVTTFVAFLFYSMIEIFTVIVDAKSVEMVAYEIIGTLLAAIPLLMFSAVCYKFFVVSIILFGITVLPLIFLMNMETNPLMLFEIHSSLELGMLIFVGAICILVGGFLSYFLSLLVYKRPFSPSAFGAALKKNM